MASKASGREISRAEFRRILIGAQLLGRRAPGGIAQTVEQAGPLRTLGGVDVYLALRARIPNFKAAQLEQAVEERLVQVIPAARGCIYLVAGQDAGWLLQFAAGQRASRDVREFARAGIRPGELEELGNSVVEVLRRQGRLSTSDIRRSLPENSVRSLGDAGKQVGLSSPLPPALRQLEFDGRIERFLEGRRLDSERYLWGVKSRSPETTAPDLDAGALNRRLAELFFRAAGLATPRMFAAWSGLSLRDANAALEGLRLEAFHVEDDSELFLGTLPTASAPEAGISFLPFEDNLIALQGGPRRLVDGRFHDVPVPVWGSTRRATLGAANHSTLRSILVGDQIVGFWEFSPTSRRVETYCFAELGPTRLEQVREESELLGDFINNQLGHGRSFSLDSDVSLAERVDFIRSLALSAE